MRILWVYYLLWVLWKVMKNQSSAQIKALDTLFYSSEEHFLSDKTRCLRALK